MDKEVKQFIRQNIALIKENTPEAWEEIYDKLKYNLRGKVTEALLVANIDPAKFMGQIPNYYLYNSNIQEYKIPNNVTWIGASAFEYCDSLTSIEIPEGVPSIGNFAFYFCDSLTNIVIPNSMEDIGNEAFRGCRSLKSIKYNGTREQWIHISKGYDWDMWVSATEIICTDGVIKL